MCASLQCVWYLHTSYMWTQLCNNRSFILNMRCAFLCSIMNLLMFLSLCLLYLSHIGLSWTEGPAHDVMVRIWPCVVRICMGKHVIMQRNQGILRTYLWCHGRCYSNSSSLYVHFMSINSRCVLRCIHFIALCGEAVHGGEVLYTTAQRMRSYESTQHRIL